MKNNRKKVLIAGVALLCLIAILVFVVTANSGGKKLENQLDLGQKYLSEMDYEQAAVAFEAALDIDSKNTDAYIGLADAYVGLENFEAAIETLERGYELTESEEISQQLEKLRARSKELEETSEEPVRETAVEEEPIAEEEFVEEDQTEIPPVPETDEWAANLYEALLVDDYQTVLEIAPNPETVRENCTPYEDASWSLWDYETAYRMEMSDGQVMGIILYEYEDGNWEIDSFVSYQPGDGFEYTGYGDHQVTLYSDGGYSYLQNGNELISESEYQGGFTMEGEGDIYVVWHM